MPELTRSLLSRVSWRMYAGRLCRRLGWAITIGLLVGAAVILATRLTGTLEIEQSRWALLAAPLLAAVGVLAATRRPGDDTAARLVDDEAATDDLFLTTVTLDRQPDTYEPLVAARADRHAAEIEPARIVDPFQRLPWKWLAAGLLLAIAADMFTPLRDPFNTLAEAKEQERLEETLKRDREEIQLRKAELAQQVDGLEDEDLTPEVQAALDQLDETMAEMRPEQPEQNKADLGAAQREMSKLWEEAREKLSKELMNRNASGQKFGGETAQKHKEWKEQLQSGETEGIREELEQIRELLEEAANLESDGTAEGEQVMQEKREELLRQAEQKMAEMKDFAEREIGSEELAQAMERAMRQMDAAQQEQLTQEAIEAMQESGELSEMEVEQLAQAARDLEAIQEAMETLQAMREMEGRNEGEFDPTECEDCETAQDYERFYKEQLAQNEGMNGRGEREEGSGEPVEEAELVSEGFKKEQSDSFIEKGEMLMSLSGKGDGSLDEDEEREFKAVRKAAAQEAIEAIELEDIPPGYQDKIKKYFRSMDAE